MSALDSVHQERSSRTAAEWLWPLLPICVSVFCLSALFYFHVNHGAVHPTSPLQQLIAGLYRIFGLAPSVMFFLLVATWSTIWFVTGSLDRPAVRFARLVAMTLMLGVFLNIGEDGVTPAVHKGELGAWLAATLVSAIGYFPSIVIVWAVTFASLLLATDFFFSDSFERLRARSAPTEVGVEAEAADHLRGLGTVPLAAPAFAPETPLHRAAPALDAIDVVVDTPRTGADGAEGELAAGQPIDTEADAEAREWPEDGAGPAALQVADDLAFADVAVADEAEPAAPATREALLGQELNEQETVEQERVERVVAEEPVVPIPRPAAPVDEPAPVRQQSLFDAPAVDETLIAEATELLAGTRRVTASLLQRRLRIDYAQALELLAQLASRGVVALEADASQGRVVV